MNAFYHQVNPSGPQLLHKINFPVVSLASIGFKQIILLHHKVHKNANTSMTLDIIIILPILLHHALLVQKHNFLQLQ
jgi:EamA domain-containing membrane protein RarD